jgi:hypothetical protein
MAGQLTRLRRTEGWERRLGAFLRAAETRSFDWQSGNCCLFVADAVEVQTGGDIAADFRNADLHDEAAAQAAMQSYCGGGVRETMAAVAERAGFREVAPARASRGDMVYSGSAGGVAGLVGMDPRLAIFLLPERGFARLPLLAWCDTAWSLG